MSQESLQPQLLVTMSLTCTESVFPQSSVARYIRVTLYVPQLMLVVVSVKFTATLASTPSLAVTTGQFGVAGQLIVAFEAQVIVGGAVSITLIVALQVEVLPQ